MTQPASVGDDFGRYLTETGRYPLLNRDSEVRLSGMIEAGAIARARLAYGADVDPAARHELESDVELAAEATATFVQANLRLVVSLARRYHSSGMPLLDLIQDAISA